MSDESKVLAFTLSDHDLLVNCALGIKDILTKLQKMDEMVADLDSRVKNVEDWKIRVMAIVGFVGLILGFIVGKVAPLMLVR